MDNTKSKKIDVSTIPVDELVTMVKDYHAGHGRGRYPAWYNEALNLIPEDSRPAQKAKVVISGQYVPKSTDYPDIPTDEVSARNVLSWWANYPHGRGRPPKAVSAAKAILGADVVDSLNQRTKRVKEAKESNVRTRSQFLDSLPPESSDVLLLEADSVAFNGKDGRYEFIESDGKLVFRKDNEPSTETDFIEALMDQLP